ncbi:MAG: AAA family ATPase [Ignavibacteriae bacterium]|nr:AAA family ATPase [Ignavibacteriota bacterium]
MEQQNIIIQRAKTLDILHSSAEKLKKKQGSVIFLSGETGFGKTTLLRVFEDSSQKQDKALVSMAACQAPVGTMQVGMLQPLGPFLRLIEELKSSETVMTPKKKLAINIGMTLLTSVPYFGDLVDAVKEINRDVQLYKNEKEKTEGKKDEQEKKDLYLEFFQTLSEWSSKSPLILILDDMHWCDAESALLIEKLIEKIDSLPILLVIAYRRSIAEETLSPLLSVLRTVKDNGKSYRYCEVEAFSKSEVHELCVRILPQYSGNAEFESTLYDKTSGIPSVVTEYVRYFAKVSPFKDDGSVKEEFTRGDLLPSSVHAAFSKLIENLNEEEMMLLSLCAAEGVESSAFIISKLLNTDIVTAIRRIKRVQAKTGVLRSLGPHERYGVKTTLFEFTQTFYREYFEKSLEYEEKTAIHSQMMHVLQEQAEGLDEVQRSKITPYIVAHANGAGEKEVMQHGLLEIAQTSQHMSLPSMSGFALQQYDANIKQLTSVGEESPIDMKLQRARIGAELREDFGMSVLTPEQVEYREHQKEDESEEQLHETIKADSAGMEREMITLCDEGSYEQALNQGNEFLGLHAGSIPKRDEAMISLLMARISLIVGEHEKSDLFLKETDKIQEKIKDPIIECLLDNAHATYHLSMNEDVPAWKYLQKAAQSSVDLGREYQLLTIANIAKLLSGTRKSEANKYKKAAQTLAKALNMPSLNALISSL